MHKYTSNYAAIYIPHSFIYHASSIQSLKLLDLQLRRS